MGPFEERIHDRCARCAGPAPRSSAPRWAAPRSSAPRWAAPQRDAGPTPWPPSGEPPRPEPGPGSLLQRLRRSRLHWRRPAPAPPPRVPVPPPNPWLRRAKRAAAALTVVAFVTVVAASSLRVWTPSSSRFMRIDDGPIAYQYVSLDHVSRYVVASVIAHEDDQMGLRAQAFHWGDFADRARAHLTGEEQQTYSTIPQQLAKNMFFTPDQSAVRKAVETVPSVLLSATLPDARIMELYLNYAQFGPDLYGVCAASWYYFDTPPWEMYQYHAMQLAGMLPNPEDVVRLPGGGVATPADAQYPSAAFHINGAANVDLPARFAGWGGWENLVASVGIDDSAADHADDRPSDDSCSSMPEPVRQRLAVEDPGFVSRSQ
ncbi:transglycosylase domain-containing protein [Rhodococcus sp. M8]|nr:glycosyltransferase [Rhodococcus sp. M8]QPG47642.1 transglycosylase domain-containing protein [Rhodococcus sp. M8]